MNNANNKENIITNLADAISNRTWAADVTKRPNMPLPTVYNEMPTQEVLIMQHLPAMVHNAFYLQTGRVYLGLSQLVGKIADGYHKQMDIKRDNLEHRISARMISLIADYFADDLIDKVVEKHLPA